MMNPKISMPVLVRKLAKIRQYQFQQRIVKCPMNGVTAIMTSLQTMLVSNTVYNLVKIIHWKLNWVIQK